MRRHNEELFEVVLCEDRTKIQQLLEKSVDINLKDTHKPRALHLAVEKNFKSTVQLLENGAKIHEKDGNKKTALHLAAECGYETVVQLLLTHGAKISQRSKTDHTALGLVMVYDKPK